MKEYVEATLILDWLALGRKLKVFWWLKLIGYPGAKDLRSFSQVI